MFHSVPGPVVRMSNQTLAMQRLDLQNYLKATSLFSSLRRKAEFLQIWYRFRKQRSKLLDLSTINDACRVKAQYDLGSQSVVLDQIVGSESRSQDYDAKFRPLRNHLKQRWVGIAALRMMNVDLPNVELIQIGDAYFVIDGHHRISVARSLGQTYIDANVIVWHLEVKPLAMMVESAPVASQYCPSGLSLAKGG